MKFSPFSILFLLLLTIISNVYCQPEEDACLIDPTDPLCVDYTLSDMQVQMSVDMLCNMMPQMNGCSVNHYCYHEGMNEGYCAPFSILKDLCIDMPMMGGCQDYQKMCATPGSVVAQCETPYLSMASTMETTQLIQSMCSSHYMPQCETFDDCTGSASAPCDTLELYSDLCKSMPNMFECQMWDELCMQVSEWDICSQRDSDGDTIPIMRMFFHTGISDYILFESWVPETDAEYVGSWFAIFFAAILLEILRACRAFFEFRVQAGPCDCDPKDRSLNAFLQYHPFRCGVDLLRACLHFFDVMWALLLMLVAMTFNVGLFFAVGAGALIGHFAVGRYFSSRSAEAEAPRGAACH
eukprot:CAMPEP_0201544484 /NCGR_PEP_ID=MMETSP0173_2-20130828/1099_1 /ASSEMBLY_ACC=CAM_ASM_000268 /TAXON_ID=218659 /ORGANISM="Vexillifera sp., Strain DIVA3 564/2" /LENGTH=352 /DNA_ID=CAMNT_0047952613 /DNA_START=47 /DNA_END=1105 /DNA_ORIENTATION=+